MSEDRNFYIIMFVLFVLAIVLISFGTEAIEPKGGELGDCYEYPEPLILVNTQYRSTWDQCYNPETEQYVQCVPISVECK